MEAAIKDNIRTMIPYLTILNAADDCIKEAESCTLEGEERIAFLTSCRNRALAHASGTPEAAFLGNLSEEPTVYKAELMGREMTEKGADMIIAARDNTRSRALGLV